MPKGTCSVDSCERDRAPKRSMCATHRYRKHYGKPLDTPIHYYSAKGTTLPERLWARTDKAGECWLWTGTTRSDGYGVIRFQRHLYSVHRLAYELEVAPIPKGLTIDHLCRVRVCVNPAHLEAVTLRENIQREMAHRYRRDA